jgi:predicted  nucleic acid-binding Zn-ribbon protein
MSEGYCVKCKAKKEIANGVEETMKNGRRAIKGKCPTCGTVMFKILGKAAAGESRPAKADQAKADPAKADPAKAENPAPTPSTPSNTPATG